MSGRVLECVDSGRGSKAKGMGVTRMQSDAELGRRTIQREAGTGSAEGAGNEGCGSRWGTWA